MQCVRRRRAPAAAGGVQEAAATSPTGAAPPALPHAYCLMPIPQSQPVLPCLLRRLLLQGDRHGARVLAQHHQPGPHFPRSLEWLLFSALDHDFSAPSGSEASASGDLAAAAPAAPTPRNAAAPLLNAAFDLVRRFPQWRDIVVNVSRKTDATMWPLLFSVVGLPSKLLDHLLRARQVRHHGSQPRRQQAVRRQQAETAT